MAKKLFKFVALLLCFSLIFEQAGFAQLVTQLDIAGHLSSLRNVLRQDKFRPLHLRYLSYDNLSNNFKLLLDKGDVKDLDDMTIEGASLELLNYFFVGLSLPNDSFWVNLRPDSPDNIIDNSLAQTEIGRILLEADLQLKKDTALATSLQTPEGKEYWDKLYKKAEELFGYENVTIPTLTRPWIVPDEILLQESQGSAYIYKATLKVMLEQDYLKDSATYSFDDPRLKELNEYSSRLIRELIIPKVTKEINSSKRYVKLRQVYYSLIFAQWFKKRFTGKNGVYPALIDTKNLNGLASQEQYSKNRYFQAYQKSFKDGEYNFQESRYTPYGQTIRSYFSGGADLNLSKANLTELVGDPLKIMRLSPSLAGPIEISGGDITNSAATGRSKRTPSLAGEPKVAPEENSKKMANEDAGIRIVQLIREQHKELYEPTETPAMRGEKLERKISEEYNTTHNKRVYKVKRQVNGKLYNITFIKLRGLFDATGQLGHIGFWQSYGRTVVYIDEEFANRAEMVTIIENHEFKEVSLWDAECQRRGMTFATLRNWMRDNVAEAFALADRFHKQANDTKGCNINELIGRKPSYRCGSEEMESVTILPPVDDLLSILKKENVTLVPARIGGFPFIVLLGKMVNRKDYMEQTSAGRLLLPAEKAFWKKMQRSAAVVLDNQTITEESENLGLSESQFLSLLGIVHRTSQIIVIDIQRTDYHETLFEETLHILEGVRSHQYKEVLCREIVNAFLQLMFYAPKQLGRFQNVNTNWKIEAKLALYKRYITETDLNPNTKLRSIIEKLLADIENYIEIQAGASKNILVAELLRGDGRGYDLSPDQLITYVRQLLVNEKFSQYHVLFSHWPQAKTPSVAAEPANEPSPAGHKYEPQKAKTAVEELMNKPVLSSEDEEIFEFLSVLAIVYPDEAINLLRRLLSHTQGRIVYLAAKTLERLRPDTRPDKIVEIYTEALHGNNISAHNHILNPILRELVLRTPLSVTLNMVEGIIKVFKTGEEWPRLYAFQILSIIIADPEVKREVKERARLVLKKAIENEYIKAYPQGESISDFLGSWLSNNPFSLQAISLKNVVNAIVKFRNIKPIKPDRQTSYLTERNGSQIPVATVPMKQTYPDILEEEFLHSTVSVAQNGGALSEGLIPMRSESFSECHAVLIRDRNTNNYLLFHFQSSAPALYSELPFEKYIEYLGDGEKEAIYLANSSNRAIDYAHRSEEYLLRKFGIKTSRFINVNAGKILWSLVFRPTTNQLIIYSSNEAYIFEAFGPSPSKESLLGGNNNLTNPSSSLSANDKAGGIDFSNLSAVTQAASNLNSEIDSQALQRLSQIDLAREWLEIEKLANSEITPSSERIKEYVQSSCVQNSLSKDYGKVILCIANILRRDEENCVFTDETLRDILILLASGIPASELKRIFTGVNS